MKSSVYDFLIIFIIIYPSTSEKTLYKEIKIADGPIRGRILKTDRNNVYYAFQDIPYAKPPTGDLRLKEPTPPEKWTKVLNATDNLKICPQFQEGHEDKKENEDCLVLNVYTPVDPQRTCIQLPVFVWIHGGSFTIFSGIKDVYGPDYYIDKGVVVVTMNYRLGPLGFISTEDDVIPKNLGLKDQLLAIKWVKKNIASFGGDPNKVTLGGQSAGAVSTCYHILNTREPGLFRGAILESGTALNCFSLQKHAQKFAFTLGSLLNSKISDSSSSTELLDVLMSAKLKDLQEATFKMATRKIEYTNCFPNVDMQWSPVIEFNNDSNSLVLGLSHEKVKNGQINRVPILIGVNSQELIFYGAPLIKILCDGFDLDYSMIINENLRMKSENRKTAGTEIREIYTNFTLRSDVTTCINSASAAMFNVPSQEYAVLHSEYADTYYYNFSYRGLLGKMSYHVDGQTGVGHFEEISYFWKNNTLIRQTMPKQDWMISDRVMELWTQFIKYLNPTAKRCRISGKVRWPKVTSTDFHYLDIDSELLVKKHPNHFLEWKAVYNKYADETLDTY
ncbi:venom carboxylesterase-6-like [Diabrotica undecimpunctata]|uniref:venom carboxylesterase-6-like n=1 Tax=Diabrotica undecimpunctata TaxID=50387 RepID=UPI003B6407B1